jgi:hypothetical protein
MKIKTIQEKAKEIDEKASDLSKEMSTMKYTITAEKLDVPMKRMRKVIRMMGFKNSETDQIINSVKTDLVRKEMHKGDDFKALMTEVFTKAIMNAVEKVKDGK